MKAILTVNRLIAFATGLGLICVITGPRLLGVGVAAFGIAWMVRGKIDTRWFCAELDKLMENITALLGQHDAEQQVVLEALDDLLTKFIDQTASNN